MSKSFKKDLTGQRFGRLTVLEFIPRPDKPKRSYWFCRCDCGNEKIVKGNHLISGRTKSCGCFQKEQNKATKNVKHGETKTRLYNIWSDIKRRCYYPREIGYKNYGGRGISVCDEWRSDFVAFRDWALTNGYKDDLSIDRIDVNGNYEPNNCRWTDAKTQSRNRCNNIIVEYNGRKMCLAEVAELSGIGNSTLLNRYHHGDRGERLFRPVRPKKK